MRSRLVLILFLVTTLALLAGACGGEEEAEAPEAEAPAAEPAPAAPAATEEAAPPAGEPIIIGLVLGLSGPNSTLSPSAVQATELAIDEVNAAGGVLGRPLELVLGDDGTDPRIAVDAWDSVVNQKKAHVVIALETSATREAGVPIAEKANVPAIYTSLYEGFHCSPILYVNAEVPNQQIDPLVEYVTQERGVKTFFLVGADYIWPRKSFEIAKELIAAEGAELVGEEYAPIGTTEWTAIVSKIQSSGADALLLALAGGSDNVAFMKQFNAAGIDAVVSTLSIEESVLNALGPDGEGIIMSGAYFNVLDTPANQKYLADLKAKYGDDTAPQNLLSVTNYDAVHAYALAVEKAGTTETGPVLQALSEVTWAGPRGEVSMTTDRHATLPAYLAQGKADATFEILKDLGRIEAADQCEVDPPFGS